MAKAELSLDEMNARVESMRAVLIRLLQDVVRAESRLDSSHAAQLREANEQLLVTALSAQTEADAAAKALAETSRTAGLDPLTALPNRALLLDRLGHAVAQARRRAGRLAVLFLDLDDFKPINDTLGHAAGDAVLKHVAQSLALAVREVDTVGRYGGDEFLIVLSEVSQPSDAAQIADKAIAAIAAPCRVGDRALSLKASVGIALFPDDGDEAAVLIDRADAAMYLAKQQGRGTCAFHGAPTTRALSPSRPEPRDAADARFVRYEQALAANDERLAQLQEVNEHLVLAALSAQELAAAADDARRRQKEFLAAVALELSNPMAPIRIATAMLGRLRSDEPLLPRAQAIIEQQAAQIARLVGVLRNPDAAAPDVLTLESREVDMAALVAEAVRACRPAIERRQQTLEADLPAGPIPMQGDPARLAQALTNLLDNATMYTQDRGAIRLSVTVQSETLALTLADDGIGITPEAQPTLFDPFTQDTHAIGFNGGGAGIGLTAVRAIVQAHGGHIIASSGGRGLGSRFDVTLPLRQPLPGQGNSTA